VTSRLFLPDITARTKREVLELMCGLAAEAVSNAPERLSRLVWERERVTPSGWENGLAVPNARVHGMPQPIVIVGRSKFGIDFNARDGKSARLIVMILTGDHQTQHDLLSDAGELFSRKEAIEQTLSAETFVELVAALNAPVK
jgi:mannitol/fructose-specific phosphotransferase system IIA component (Ntr-type)